MGPEGAAAPLVGPLGSPAGSPQGSPLGRPAGGPLPACLPLGPSRASCDVLEPRAGQLSVPTLPLAGTLLQQHCTSECGYKELAACLPHIVSGASCDAGPRGDEAACRAATIVSAPVSLGGHSCSIIFVSLMSAFGQPASDIKHACRPEIALWHSGQPLGKHRHEQEQSREPPKY